MYTDQLCQFVRKANLVIFGQQAEVFKTDYPVKSYSFSPCEYVFQQTGLIGVPSDPYLLAIVRQHQLPQGDFYLIFEKRLAPLIEDSLLGRPHMKAPILLWSITAKAIWRKVGSRRPRLQVAQSFNEAELSCEQLAECLPVGFEFAPDFPSSPVEAVRAIYEWETEGYEFELGPQTKALYGPIASFYLGQIIEMAVISQIAVRCRGELQLLQFLKACADLAMAP